jgi:putative toxin-antitoxin system antitoxin component (TIGR02293 family)
MASEVIPQSTPAADADLAGVADLLGLRRWRAAGVLDDPLALHDRLARGLPASALKHFARQCPLLTKEPAFSRVIGSAPAPHAGSRRGRTGRLSSQESGQLWRLAAILAKAAPLQGGAAAAERWLLQPSIGLGRRRPLDLLETPAGCELVTDHLIQLEYGVYI